MTTENATGKAKNTTPPQPRRLGVKTSEFWITIAPALGGLMEVSKGDPETGRLLIICSTVLGSFYILSRTLAKK